MSVHSGRLALCRYPVCISERTRWQTSSSSLGWHRWKMIKWTLWKHFACDLLPDYQDSDSDVSDTDYSDDSEEEDFVEVPEPCRFYNKGFCRKGAQCDYLHVCKFALRGSCRNGSNCRLSHDIAGGGRRRSDTQTQGSTWGGNHYCIQKHKHINYEMVMNICVIQCRGVAEKCLFFKSRPNTQRWTVLPVAVVQWKLLDGYRKWPRHRGPVHTAQHQELETIQHAIWVTDNKTQPKPSHGAERDQSAD